jgi:hypothetical protein
VWRLYLNRAVAAGDDAVFESALAYSKHPVMNVHVAQCAVWLWAGWVWGWRRNVCCL